MTDTPSPVLVEGEYRDYANQDVFRLERRRNGHWIEVWSWGTERQRQSYLQDLLTRGIISLIAKKECA